MENLEIVILIVGLIALGVVALLSVAFYRGTFVLRKGPVEPEVKFVLMKKKGSTLADGESASGPDA